MRVIVLQSSLSLAIPSLKSTNACRRFIDFTFFPSFWLTETSVYSQGIALYAENTYSKCCPEGEDTCKVKTDT